MNPPVDRRQFLTTLAAASVASPLLARGLAAAEPAVTPAGTSAGPRCLHVFSKPLHWLSYEDTASMVAEAGFGGIDFSVRPGGHVLPERVRDDLPRAVAAARAAGLKVEMITTGIVRADEPHAEAVLETAAKLGVKYYRMGWISYDLNLGVWETLQRLKPGIRKLAELNQRLGLHGAYQNHSGVRIGGSGWDVHELIRECDPRWLGCQYDVRHATVEGGQSWPVAMRLLAPWIRCVDIKDFHWAQGPGKAAPETVPLGEGVVNFTQYFALLKELRITGPMSVHFEYAPLEGGPQLPAAERRRVCLAAMRKDAETLKGWMKTAGVI